MAAVKLVNGETALVDDDVFIWVEQWYWRISNGYAVRSKLPGEPGPKNIFLHRALFPPPAGLVCDHINRNRLDNRSCNIRWVTPAENLQNRNGWGATSPFKGVYWDAERGRWRATLGGRKLGRFTDEVEAALAYDQAADEVGWLGPRNFS